jgi:hypothetical protein
MQMLDGSPGRDSREEVEVAPGQSSTDAGQPEKPQASRRGYCQRCQEDVAVVMKRRFTGVRSGGMQSQAVCVSCGRVLQVP